MCDFVSSSHINHIHAIFPTQKPLIYNSNKVTYAQHWSQGLTVQKQMQTNLQTHMHYKFIVIAIKLFLFDYCS